MSSSRKTIAPATVWRLSLLFVAVGLWTLSLFLPAIRPTGFGGVPSSEWWPGYSVFIMGWTGLLFGIPGWLANVFWLAAFGVGFSRARVWSFATAIIGLAIAATVLLGFEIPDPNGGSGPVLLGVGYWVWMATPLPILVAAGLPEPNTATA